MGNIYKHENGMFLKLVKKRESNVNTYIQVDELGVPVLFKKDIGKGFETQNRIVKGFDKLTKI